MTMPLDVLHFLSRYPSLAGREDKHAHNNVLFYKNALRCQPDNVTLETIHTKWRGKYDTLEYGHGFIQWLFPIRESGGVNWQAQRLMLHEIEEMTASPQVLDRIRESYDLMLDFYGMTLSDRKTGRISRSASPKQSERYRNLLQSPHNYLRITRIIKHLGEITPLSHYAAAFLLFLISEQSDHSLLRATRLMNSQEYYWNNCLRNKEERKFVKDLYADASISRKMVFTTEKYEEVLERRDRTGKLSLEEEEVKDVVTTTREIKSQETTEVDLSQSTEEKKDDVGKGPEKREREDATPLVDNFNGGKKARLNTDTEEERNLDSNSQ